MKYLPCLWVCLIMAVAAGCKDKPPTPPPAPMPIIKTGGRELTLSGVKFLIPYEEEASHSDSPGGFTYTSPSMRVTMARGLLYVNATNYGAIKGGDAVNLLNPGRVIVNEQERKQVPASGMFQE